MFLNVNEPSACFVNQRNVLYARNKLGIQIYHFVVFGTNITKCMYSGTKYVRLVNIKMNQ